MLTFHDKPLTDFNLFVEKKTLRSHHEHMVHNWFPSMAGWHGQAIGYRFAPRHLFCTSQMLSLAHVAPLQHHETQHSGGALRTNR
jgi:hypothetical protein